MTYADKLALVPPGFTFLVIGAADGKTLDPFLFKIINLRRGTGVFVEPLRDLFDDLKENYKDKSGIEFINAAIDNKTGTRTMTRVSKAIREPIWTIGLASFYARRNALIMPELDRHLRFEDVQTITLDEVVGEEAPYLLQIDTEGHDWVIFDQWDWAWGKPKIICIENTRVPQDESDAISQKLGSAGYQTFQDGDNLIATI